MLLSKTKFFIYLSFFYITLIGKDFDVLDYGAKGDGITLDTKAVQKTIDAAYHNHGGKVIIPSGKVVVIGTIYLKDYVTLHIENGATLLGSPKIENYTTDTHKNMYKNEPHMDRCLIFSKNTTSIAITGKGTIDGNGSPDHFNRETGRPMLLRFLNCTDIHINDINLINPAAWTSAFLYCQNISINGIKIHSRINYNGDGLDFDGCQDVKVSNSTFNTSDDSICLQASLPNKPCKNITVSNCTFESKWAGMRIGLLSRGDFESVSVSNCTFKNIDDAGLKIQMNEGGTMQNMTFSNLIMRNVPRPIFMTFAQQRACVDAPEEMYPMKKMRNFIFENIIADNKELDKNSGIFITGMPNYPIENILLKNIQLHLSGGGDASDANKTVFKEYTLETLNGWWPEFHLVGTLPSVGLFARHVSGLYMDNVHIHTSQKDQRKPIVFQDIAHYKVSNSFYNYNEISQNRIHKIP